MKIKIGDKKIHTKKIIFQGHFPRTHITMLSYRFLQIVHL